MVGVACIHFVAPGLNTNKRRSEAQEPVLSELLEGRSRFCLSYRVIRQILRVHLSYEFLSRLFPSFCFCLTSSFFPLTRHSKEHTHVFRQRLKVAISQIAVALSPVNAFVSTEYSGQHLIHGRRHVFKSVDSLLYR